MIEIEPDGENSGHCDCCGRQSRTIWGFVRNGGEPIASYFFHWTLGASLEDHPANFDLIYGKWGDNARKADRCAISMVHFSKGGTPGVALIDADTRPVAMNDLVGSAASREEIIGTPLAQQVFAIFDAVITQDARCG